MTPETRYCPRCGETKPSHEFRPTGGYCRPCRSEYARAYYRSHPEKFDSKRPHLAAKPCARQPCDRPRWISPSGHVDSRCREHNLADGRARYRRDHPPRIPRDPFEVYVSARGMTVSGYAELLASQGGGCAICGATEKLVVDHDHLCCPSQAKSGAPWCGQCVRGILCHPCNTAIGMMRDDPERLESASRYLGRRRLKVVA